MEAIPLCQKVGFPVKCSFLYTNSLIFAVCHASKSPSCSPCSARNTHVAIWPPYLSEPQIFQKEELVQMISDSFVVRTYKTQGRLSIISYLYSLSIIYQNIFNFEANELSSEPRMVKIKIKTKCRTSAQYPDPSVGPD